MGKHVKKLSQYELNKQTAIELLERDRVIEFMMVGSTISAMASLVLGRHRGMSHKNFMKNYHAVMEAVIERRASSPRFARRTYGKGL